MYDAPITKKIFDVLKFVVGQQYDVGVSEIARAGSLSKGTTFGILAGLEKAGYVAKNETTKKYSVGQELFQLSKLIQRRTDLAAIAKPHMERLSRKTNRTVFLGVKDGERIRIAEVAEAKGLLTVSLSIGTKLPLDCGAHGRAILSMMRDDEIAERITGQFLSASRNRQESTDIWSRIEDVRRTGYALDMVDEYTPGVWAVAMALDCAATSCPAAVWVAGFKACLNDKKLNKIIAGLRETVNNINAAGKRRFEEADQGQNPERSVTRTSATAERLR